LEIDTRLQYITYRIWHLGIKWSRDRKRHVTLIGRGRNTNMLAPIILNMTGDAR